MTGRAQAMAATSTPTLEATHALIGSTEAVRTARQIRSAIWFVGFSLALTAVASAFALAGIVPALLPFVLAIGPAFIALGLARREGDGSARRLMRTITT